MNRFATSLIGKPVLLNQEKALVGIVEELVIEPKNGSFIGILVREGFGRKNLKAIASKDILVIGEKFILTNSYSSIGEIDDIVRIKKALDEKAKIIGSKVFTVSGRYLGKVYDFTIDLKLQVMAKIFVKPKLLNALSSDYIIGQKQIVSIEKNKIVVEDGSISSKDTVRTSTIKPEIGGI